MSLRAEKGVSVVACRSMIVTHVVVGMSVGDDDV